MSDGGDIGTAETRSPWGAWIAFGIGYLALAEVSDWLTNEASQFATFWPAAGLYVGALLLAERRRWPGFLAAAALADLLVSFHVGRRPALALALTAGDLAEAVLAASLVRGYLGRRPRMWRLRDVLAVMVLAAVVAPIGPALLGGATTAHSNGVPFATAAFQWWVGDGLGILVVTPLMLAWAVPDGVDRNPVLRRPLEFSGLAIATVGVSLVVFRQAQEGVLAEEHLVLPVFVWAALRFGPRGVTAAGAMLAFVAAWATTWAAWLSGARALVPDAGSVQGYLSLAIATSLLLAAEVAGRERTERRLQLARFALDQGGEAFLVADASGRVVLASEAAGRLLGRSSSTLLGSLLASLDPAAGRRLGAQEWPVMRALGRVNYESIVSDASGRRVPVEVHLSFLTADGAEFLAWSARDLSDRNRAEEEHRLAAVGTLAAGVAHEINNPLTYVTANLAFLEETLGKMRGLHPDVEEAEEAASEASLGARRVRDIVRDLRFVARPPDGRRVEVDPATEIRSALNLAQAEIHRRASLSLRLDPCPSVLAGQGQIGQVMLHLLVNAAQSTPPGAPAAHAVRVSSRTDENGWAAIEVSDTGVGISASARAHIFEPFFTTRTAGGGPGLGLSVSHGIVTGLGGSIEVASEEGRGTTVRVRLPPAVAVS
ncbi:MAG: MASE1 domain-containing protein [Anaeromyxobacteraceae bacterium]